LFGQNPLLPALQKSGSLVLKAPLSLSQRQPASASPLGFAGVAAQVICGGLPALPPRYLHCLTLSVSAIWVLRYRPSQMMSSRSLQTLWPSRRASCRAHSQPQEGQRTRVIFDQLPSPWRGPPRHLRRASSGYEQTCDRVATSKRLPLRPRRRPRHPAKAHARSEGRRQDALVHRRRRADLQQNGVGRGPRQHRRCRIPKYAP
jgi:hypothetical protein